MSTTAIALLSIRNGTHGGTAKPGDSMTEMALRLLAGAIISGKY
jgi:hypothetical protein